MKKEMSLPLHILYVVFLSTFTLSVGLGFFLFSFDTLLSYFNYPLVYDFTLSPFFPAFCGSTLACILPPLFLIGTVRKYEFKERLMRILEVQAFFFALLVIIFSFFMYYTVQREDNMRAVMNMHYFSAYTRIVMCLYFYLSIKISLASQDKPLPSSSSLYGYAIAYQNMCEDKCADKSRNESVSETVNNFEAKSRNKIEAKFEKKFENAAWKKHQEELPRVLKMAFRFAQIIGFVMLGSAFFSIEGIGAPSFTINYSFFSVFFLYFYLLYKMRERPYASWRPAYVCLNLYISTVYGLNEYGIWQIVFLLFFLCQCYIVYVLYLKSRNWFVS